LNILSEDKDEEINEIREYEDAREKQMAKNKEALKSNLNTPPC
jgi:hypothetical protein